MTRDVIENRKKEKFSKFEECFDKKLNNQDVYLKLLRIAILLLSAFLAFLVRLFSVLRYEVVIHEFDPYFNYMTTKYLTDKGFYSFLNWFDDRAWYPLGRIIGGTIYPGLMMTSSFLYYFLHLLNITVHIRDVCVFLAPFFSSLTTIITYHLTTEISDNHAGLCSAAFISIVPGYVSRSVAGSYDNEAIAIFCMLSTYYCWIKAIKTGTLFWSTICSLLYFYMVSSWGGYVFLINLIPLHVLILMITGRFKHKIYVAYSVFYVIGTLLSMQIPFVGFQPTFSSEHMASLCVFGLCQILIFTRYLSSILNKELFEIFFRSVVIFFITAFIFFIILLGLLEKISPLAGRFYALLDPSYAKNNIPIIASVSEHQPTAWSSFYFDLHLLLFLFPVGLYVCFKKLNDSNIFIILYGVTSIYFTGVMVRLMLVLAPVMCIVSSIGLSRLLCYHSQQWKARKLPELNRHEKKFSKGRNNTSLRHEIGKFFVILTTGLLISYSIHCIWVTNEAYSSPSIILSARTHHGIRLIFDDFREAYYWLRMNTKENSKILSWWDYGYQIAAMANRTTIVDNNTWNNTHISRVGQAMASDEKTAYRMVQEFNSDYVLILFGGFIGYASDDLNKFMWMIRIGASTPEGKNIREKDYLSVNGDFRVGKDAPNALKNSLLYKLSYFQFDKILTESKDKGPGYDRVRQTEIGEQRNIELKYFEEAYTTGHWLVRIYRVKKPQNRGDS